MDTETKLREVATGEWQQFYNRWRDSSTSSKSLNAFPYVLELGVDPESKSLLPFHVGDTPGNRILVTKSYDDMFRRVLYLCQCDKGKDRGVVLAGQPGIGASLWPGPYPVGQLTNASVLQEKLSS